MKKNEMKYYGPYQLPKKCTILKDVEFRQDWTSNAFCELDNTTNQKYTAETSVLL